MRTPRLFIETPLNMGTSIRLEAERSHYLSHVLRLRKGDTLTLFNGEGGEYPGRLTDMQKKSSRIEIEGFKPLESESPLRILLVQAVAKPTHMDWVLQKATELGVTEILPLNSERSRAFDGGSDKRRKHWRNILISACEQCGRNRLPLLHESSPLDACLKNTEGVCRTVLAPVTPNRFRDLPVTQEIALFIGAEGGFSQAELEQMEDAGVIPTGFGPRILRTETAALSAVSLAQSLWGDMSGTL